jgi:amidohydrolase
MIAEFHEEIATMTPQLVAWRRDFHRHPEIANQERRTSGVIRAFLEGLGLEVATLAGTGLRAVIAGSAAGPTVALRADMDALPLQEEGSKEYLSENPGAAHSCGHDAHMAILMGVVELLAARREQLAGRVVALFQPSEEKFPGGAKPMIAEGALDGVEAIFGLHVWQSLPTGRIGIVKGPMLAQPDVFEIRVRGRGGHGALPQQTVDPIVTAAYLVANAQTIVSRNRDPLAPLVVTFGSIHGGTVDNIIPEEVVLQGTVRTFDDATQELAERRLKEIVRATCETFGASAEIDYRRGYPPVVNDAALVERVIEVATRTLGPEAVIPISPIMGGEDFAYYQQVIPGAFLFFGTGDGMPYPQHHPAYDIDERALPQAVSLMSALALDFLARGTSPVST